MNLYLFFAWIYLRVNSSVLRELELSDVHIRSPSFCLQRLELFTCLQGRLWIKKLLFSSLSWGCCLSKRQGLPRKQSLSSGPAFPPPIFTRLHSLRILNWVGERSLDHACMSPSQWVQWTLVWLLVGKILGPDQVISLSRRKFALRIQRDVSCSSRGLSWCLLCSRLHGTWRSAAGFTRLVSQD